MASRKKVRVDALDNLPKSVDALPPFRPAEITPKEAVRAALPQIHAMQKKGYTLVAIADFLSARGIEVTALSLKRYMSLVGPGRARTPRMRGSSKAPDAAKSRVTREPDPVNGAARPAPEGRKSSSDSNVAVDSTPRIKPKSGDALPPSIPTTSTERSAAEPPKKEATTASPVRRSAFVIREDSEEI